MKQAASLRGRRTGRSLKVLQWLEKQTKPRLVRDIIKHVDASCKSNLMSGTMGTLERNGKVIRTHHDGRCLYRIAPGALISKRTGKRMGTPTKPKAATARTRQSKPSAKAQLTAQLATKPINTQRLTMANAHGGAYLAAKQLASAQIRADVAAFEAAGGKVQRLDQHECSRPLNHDYRNPGVAEAALRGGQANKKNHSKPSTVVDDGEDE